MTTIQVKEENLPKFKEQLLACISYIGTYKEHLTKVISDLPLETFRDFQIVSILQPPNSKYSGTPLNEIDEWKMAFEWLGEQIVEINSIFFYFEDDKPVSRATLDQFLRTKDVVRVISDSYMALPQDLNMKVMTMPSDMTVESFVWELHHILWQSNWSRSYDVPDRVMTFISDVLMKGTGTYNEHHKEAVVV